MEPPPDQDPPLLYGPREIGEGYYDLEAHKRNQTLQALLQHDDAVAPWYRGLTLYRSAMLGEWTLTQGEPSSPELAAAGLQMQLLGLAVGQMKAALDALLTGYYSVELGRIRHLLETFGQCLYVELEPDGARRWYITLHGGDELHERRSSQRAERTIDTGYG